MNIQAEKIELVKMILETDNPSILNSIKKILKRESKKDFWDTLPQSQREEIMKGIEEIEDITTYEIKRPEEKHIAALNIIVNNDGKISKKEMARQCHILLLMVTFSRP